MNRKQRRALEKVQRSQSKSEQKMAEQMMQFDKLPDHCLTCAKPFDKTNKEMVQTWSVVVRDKDTVRLYCPDCWTMATNVAKEYFKELNENKENETNESSENIRKVPQTNS